MDLNNIIKPEKYDDMQFLDQFKQETLRVLTIAMICSILASL